MNTHANQFIDAFKSIPRRVKAHTIALSTAVTAYVCMAVSAFASSNSYFVVSESDLTPLMNSVTANIKVVFPLMLAIVGMFIVINLVPRLMRKAVNGG